MAYYLLGAILVTYYNIAVSSLPIPEVTEYYEESLEDFLKKGRGWGAIIPETVTVSTEDKDDILKIVKDFIGHENEVERTLFFCKEGLCKILDGNDMNFNGNKTDGIIKAQRKKLMNISEEKIKEIYKAKENEVLSIDATHNRGNKEGDPEDDGSPIKSMPKLKMESVFRGHKYIKLQTNTDPFDVTVTTPALPKLMKFQFAKTRVPITTTIKSKIFYEDTKVALPESLDEMIRQYQIYPGAGCAYVKGCDGMPTKILKSPQVMALIAKIYREIADKESEGEGHQVINFYLQKYEPQHIYVEDDRFITPRKSTSATSKTTYNTECFMY